MSALFIFWRNVRWPRRMQPLVSLGVCEYAGATDRRTYGRQAVTLRFSQWTRFVYEDYE